jgi:hypothetical protein
MENAQMKFIKKDAVVEIKIGAGMIEKIMEVLQYLIKDVKEEDIKEYQKEVSSGANYFQKEKEFSQEWMYPTTILSILIKEFQTQAELQNQVIEKTMEEYIKSMDSSPFDQSQSQPE